MRVERRNFARRAEVLRKLITLLGARVDAIISEALVAETVQIPASGVRRILKRLALKMLVRNIGPSHWTATALLAWSMNVELCRCDG